MKNNKKYDLLRSKKIIVTGAFGFIGQSISNAISGYTVLGVVRELKKIQLESSIQNVAIGDINSKTDWSSVLAGAYCVIHCAARAHVVHDNEEDPLIAFRRVNVEGTRRLVEAAQVAGVKKFLFLSSIGAVADSSKNPLRSDMRCFPKTPYGKSKFEAECVLKEIASHSQMSYTIIRSPIVYGPRNPGHMEKLFKIVDAGFPLPLSSFDLNLKSFVGLSNIIELVLLCLEHPAAANQIFHVSDDDDISTAEIIRRIGKALGKPTRNLPIPQTILKTGLRVLRKGEWIDKLFGDLRVDISETKRLLGWKPKVTMEKELERTARWWRESRQGRL